MHEAADQSEEMNTYAILSNPRRKLILRYLSMFDEGDIVHVKPVARVVRGAELAYPDPEQVLTGDYEAAYNSMIQHHLPKLHDAGVIDYDRDRKKITVLPVVHRMAYLSAFGEVTLR